MPKGNYTRKVRPILWVIGPSIAYIELTLDQYSTVEKDDAEDVSRANWHAYWNPCTESYYAKNHRGSLHQFILKAPHGMRCDHINGRTLDNRRANLRVATAQQNCQNHRLRHNAMGYRGVAPAKSRINPWMARIRVDGELIYLGCFPTAKAAHLAYMKAAKGCHGEFFR